MRVYFGHSDAQKHQKRGHVRIDFEENELTYVQLGRRGWSVSNFSVFGSVLQFWFQFGHGIYKSTIFVFCFRKIVKNQFRFGLFSVFWNIVKKSVSVQFSVFFS